MELVAIYQCGDQLVFSVESMQETGFVVSTMEMLSICRSDGIERIQEVLNESLALSSLKEFEEKYTPSKFNKKLAKLCSCSNYKEVVSKSSLIKVVSNQDEITLVPMQKSKSFIGFEGYNNCVETMASSSLDNLEGCKRILDLLDEVVETYNLPS